MYNDEKFRNALSEVKSENYKELKAEVKSMERAIERFLTSIFECTSSVVERDFPMVTH